LEEISQEEIPASSTAEKLKIVVLGAGSIGCYLGACLLGQGANVTLIGRERIQAQISENGLLIR
jgi:2-dehydropantoate 2-reductase